MRRLDRSGEGEYRLNGARCRLADIIEVLSDTGLGKEMHSVVSQGKVEAIIHSKPRDRRLLIEEAAGLGKHRKRRRRAQLKLERTEANLARALDVEREARSRLRPLKRQAEAAELHERIERQSLEARLELARDSVGSAGRELAAAEQAAVAARKAQRGRRGRADAPSRSAASRPRRRSPRTPAIREALAGELFAARSAAERIGLRLERARDVERSAREGAERRRGELESLEQSAAAAGPDDAAAERVAALQRELASLEAAREGRLERELAELARERDAAAVRLTELETWPTQRAEAVEAAERAAEAARARPPRGREGRRGRSPRGRRRRRRARDRQPVPLARCRDAPGGARALAEDLGVEPGYELAVAAALGPLLSAGVVDDLAEGERLLDAASRDGGVALIAEAAPAGPVRVAGPPVDDARPLLELRAARGPCPGRRRALAARRMAGRFARIPAARVRAASPSPAPAVS